MNVQVHCSTLARYRKIAVGRRTTSTRTKGQRGEAIAARVLEQIGYTIIERNWRCEQGELDIVARHREELVFVEVRSRADNLEAALESVSPRKQRLLVALAQAYLAAHDLEDTFRIDIAAVNLRTGAVEVIEHAVGW